MSLAVGSFEFVGKNSIDNFGIYVDDIDEFIPPKRSNKTMIPGKSGAYKHNTKNVYDERGARLKCYCFREYTRSEFREIAYWLNQKGKLILWDEPEKYYIGEIFNGDEITWENTFGARPFELLFVCEPFAYKDASTTVITNGFNEIAYAGTEESPTLIVLRNVSGRTISNVEIVAMNKKGG